ncbi:MAG: LPXTG cell wall anchor domain-containing protein [Actinomycetes bacterium]
MLTPRRALAAGYLGAILTLGLAPGVATAEPTYPPVTDPFIVSTSTTVAPNATTTTRGGTTRRTIPTEVLGEQITRGADGSLPVTGGDVLGIAVIGGAAVLGGGLLLRASRRRGDAETA